MKYLLIGIAFLLLAVRMIVSFAAMGGDVIFFALSLIFSAIGMTLSIIGIIKLNSRRK